jgi:imidazolonepropionase-like amidohydrolase
MGSEGTMYADVDLKRAIRRDVVPGPKLWVSTRGLSVAGAYLPFGYSWELNLPKGAQVVSGPEECRRAVREHFANGADWIKVFVDWDTRLNEEGKITGRVMFSTEELEMIVKEAHRLGRSVAAHATGVEGIKAALDAGVDSIEHGDGLDDSLIAQAKAGGVYVCPTIMPLEHFIAEGKDFPGLKEMLDTKYESLRKGHLAGVKLVLGSDAGSFPWTNNQAKEFELLVTKAGLSPMDAIKAGTSVAAELLGQSGSIGTLAPGMSADIVAVLGDPLENISVLQKVVFVMKDGVVVHNESLASK